MWAALLTLLLLLLPVHAAAQPQSILPSELRSTNAPTSGKVPTYGAGGAFTWLTAGAGSGGYLIYNVEDYGAVAGDGLDDGDAFADALVAAESADAPVFVPAGHFDIASGKELVVARKTRFIGHPNAQITYAGTGSLFSFYSASDTDWEAGGISRIRLVGTGGGYGITIGDGTTGMAHGLVFEQVEVTGFDCGVRVYATGAAMLLDFNNSTIHNNDLYGVQIAAVPAENLSFLNTSIFNNGQGAATGTGVLIDSGSDAEVWLKGGSIDDNGDGTRAQVYAPSDANMDLHVTNVHFENTGSGAQHLPHIHCVSGASNACNVIVTNSIFLSGSAPTTVPLIKIEKGALLLTDSKIGSGELTGPLIYLGDSANRSMRFLVERNNIYCTDANSNGYYGRVYSSDAQGVWLANVTSGAAGNSTGVDFASATLCHDQTVSLGPNDDITCTGTITASTFAGNATTATQLAANGANCSSGQAALGVDAAGAAEGCWTPSGGSGGVLYEGGATSGFSAPWVFGQRDGSAINSNTMNTYWVASAATTTCDGTVEIQAACGASNQWDVKVRYGAPADATTTCRAQLNSGSTTLTNTLCSIAGASNIRCSFTGASIALTKDDCVQYYIDENTTCGTTSAAHGYLTCS